MAAGSDEESRSLLIGICVLRSVRKSAGHCGCVLQTMGVKTECIPSVPFD